MSIGSAWHEGLGLTRIQWLWRQVGRGYGIPLGHFPNDICYDMFFFSSYSILVGLEGKRNGRNGLNELEYGMESTACGNRPVRLHALKRDVTLRWLEEVRATGEENLQGQDLYV